MSSKSPLHLFVSQQTCIAGQGVHGTVALDFRSVRDSPLDEVRVELRGNMRMYVRLDFVDRDCIDEIVHSSCSRRRHCAKEDILLVYESKVLWKRGEHNSAAGTHSLRIPFSFKLPADIPPSCYVSVGGTTVRADYKVQAIGVRSGLHRNEKVEYGLKVFTPDDVGAPIKARLKGGWPGPWATKTARRRIRKGLWGSHADVQIEVRPYSHLPALRRGVSDLCCSLHTRPRLCCRYPWRSRLHFPSSPSADPFRERTTNEYGRLHLFSPARSSYFLSRGYVSVLAHSRDCTHCRFPPSGALLTSNACRTSGSPSTMRSIGAGGSKKQSSLQSFVCDVPRHSAFRALDTKLKSK